MILHGENIEHLRAMPADSVDAVVTDPPYGFKFMGKKWDYDVPSADTWREVMRVMKPGAFLLSFGGARTYHRVVCAIEDAGFEIRDCVMWVYGSGFPKSLNVAKAIDSGGGRPEDIRRMAMGEDYEPSGRGRVNYDHGAASTMNGATDGWQPSTDSAKQWSGWGTALKPAHEPIVVARKPLAGTVADNVIRFGTGALNIDGCRVEHQSDADRAAATPQGRVTGKSGALAGKVQREGERTEFSRPDTTLGRFPANVIHDGSDEVLAAFPYVESGKPCGTKAGNNNNVFGQFAGGIPVTGFGDAGSAARFFYCAKASAQDRDEGLDHFEKRAAGMVSNTSGQHMTRRDEGYEVAPRANTHPTVKPTDLMRYLCRLVTAPGGLVLDPFCGSGSTGKAAILEGFRFIGIEREAEFVPIAEARLAFAREEYRIATAQQELAL